jgi:hypothetical protein
VNTFPPRPCYFCGSCGCVGACQAPEPATARQTYLATCGVDFLHEADSLDALLVFVRGIHEPGRGESIACWRSPGELVAVILPDGALLSIANGPHARRATR